MVHNWTTAVVIVGPDGMVPLIRNDLKPSPLFWKFPGGRYKYGETPEETAIREVEEEVGLILPSVEFLLKEPRTYHDLYLYFRAVESFTALKKIGDEGERVAVFRVGEIEEMVDFFPEHRKLLRKVGGFERLLTQHYDGHAV